MDADLPIPDPPGRERRATGLSLVAFSLILGAFGLVVILHFARSDLDPVRDVMSGYANGDHGLLMTMAFYALGAGTVALGIRLILASDRHWWSWAVSVLLGVAGAGLLLAGVFEVERPGIPDTIQETIHSDGAIAGFVLIVVAMVTFTFGCLRDPRWRSFLPYSFAMAMLAVAGVVFSPLAPGTSIAGVAQRLLGLTVFGWVILVSFWIRFHPSLGERRKLPA
jgi:Protein of unknown function (DUF998)